MYSIICPTMWFGTGIKEMLPLMDQHPLVDDIILINNNKNNTPDWFIQYQKQSSKIRIDPFGEDNVFVNPAWNWGVSVAKNDKVCLLSDDITFDVNVLDKLKYKILPTTGCIGFFIDNVNTSDVIKEMPQGFGCLIFLHKNNFTPIPDELKIYYGDLWIWETYLKKKITPIVIRGFKINFQHDKMGNTSELPQFREIKQQEHLSWVKLHESKTEHYWEVLCDGKTDSYYSTYEEAYRNVIGHSDTTRYHMKECLGKMKC
jgi:hypothetical protein